MAVANLDTVRFTAADSVSSAARHRARRYSRPLHLFKVHSWMPVAVNPFKIIDEHDIDVQLGVTLVSQNLLSSAESYLAYAWNHAKGRSSRAACVTTGWASNWKQPAPTAAIR